MRTEDELTEHSQFNQIGYVSTEGGPLLVGDYEPLTKWNGIETEDQQAAWLLTTLYLPFQYQTAYMSAFLILFIIYSQYYYCL